MASIPTREDLEHAPLSVGLNLVIGTAVVMWGVAFLGLPAPFALLAVTLALILLAGGVALHVAIRAAWRERIARHHAWVGTQPPADLVEFRGELAEREHDLEHALQDWVRPLVAALVLTVGAGLVPYQLISSFAPSGFVEPVNALWAVVTLVLAATCAVFAAIAGRRQERASGSTQPAGRHVDA